MRETIKVHFSSFLSIFLFLPWSPGAKLKCVCVSSPPPRNPLISEAAVAVYYTLGVHHTWAKIEMRGWVRLGLGLIRGRICHPSGGGEGKYFFCQIPFSPEITGVSIGGLVGQHIAYAWQTTSAWPRMTFWASISAGQFEWVRVRELIGGTACPPKKERGKKSGE